MFNNNSLLITFRRLIPRKTRENTGVINIFNKLINKTAGFKKYKMYKLAVSQSDGAFAAAPSGPFAAALFPPGRKAGKTRTLHLPYPVGGRLRPAERTRAGKGLSRLD